MDTQTKPRVPRSEWVAKPFTPCTANAKTTGERCKRRPVPGAFVCVKHGGGAPAVRAKGLERLATQRLERDVTAILAHEGVLAIEDPLGELGKLASSCKALADALGKRVNAMNELEHFDAKSSPTIKAEVQMYERALDRSHRLLDSLVKHGYSERQIQIQETEAMLVAGVLRRVIAALGLTSEQQTRAQQLLAQEFRSIKPIAAPTTGTR